MKRMYTFIAVLLAFLGVAFFREGSGVSTSKHPTVGILQLMHHPSLDQIHRGFIAGLADEGFHKGKNITIDYQNAQGDQSTLKTMANKLVNDHDNVIFAITTPAAQSVANSTSKIPLVLGAVTNPQGLAWSKTTIILVAISLVFPIKHRSPSNWPSSSSSCPMLTVLASFILPVTAQLQPSTPSS